MDILLQEQGAAISSHALPSQEEIPHHHGRSHGVTHLVSAVKVDYSNSSQLHYRSRLHDFGTCWLHHLVAGSIMLLSFLCQCSATTGQIRVVIHVGQVDPWVWDCRHVLFWKSICHVRPQYLHLSIIPLYINWLPVTSHLEYGPA